MKYHLKKTRKELERNSQPRRILHLVKMNFFYSTAMVFCLWLQELAYTSFIEDFYTGSSENVLPCEEQWYYFGEKCYKVEGYEGSVLLSWDDARKRCTELGANLVSIHSMHENDFIRDLLASLNIKVSVHTGLNDQATESLFQWEDGSPYDFRNWEPEQPKNYLGREHCVEFRTHPLYSKEPGRWNDEQCSLERPYICKKASNDSPEPRFCSPEEGAGFRYRESCYNIINEKLSWDDAEMYCQNFSNGHLVMITDKERDAFLNSLLPRSKDRRWIGIKIEEKCRPKWSSGFPVVYDHLDVPFENLEGDMCILMWKENNWTATSCVEKFPFICEVSKAYTSVTQNLSTVSSENDIPCENEWYYFGGKCYKVEGYEGSNDSVRLSWDDARKRCTELGANLVSIHSMQENDFITELLASLIIKVPVHIGLNDQATESLFEWEDGSPYDFRNWEPEQPKNFLGREHCVEFRTLPLYSETPGMWNDEQCCLERPYICKKASNDSPEPRSCSPEEGAGIRYRESCYNIINEKMSWDDAEKYCQNFSNGHLVMITDKEQDVFLNSLLPRSKDRRWIGIKIEDKLQPKWSSGIAVVYDHFDVPFETLERDMCILIWKENNWTATSCVEKFPFICEVSKVYTSIIQDFSTVSSENDMPCENEWYYFGGKCYKVEGYEGSNDTVHLSWDDARKRCTEAGANLVSIHSMQENDFIRELLAVLNINLTVHIGLNDQARESIFEWEDGSPYDFRNWEPKQPKNFLGREHCVEFRTHPLYSEEPGRWNDEQCSLERPYICKKASNDSPEPRFCSPEEGAGIRYRESCYKIINKNLSWDDAEKYCQNFSNGHLVMIMDKEHDAFLSSVLPPSKYHRWIGIKIEDKFRPKWSSGFPVTYDHLPFKNSKRNMCILRAKENDWISASCVEKFPFICEISKAPVYADESDNTLRNELICEESWKKFGDFCYMIEGHSYNSFLTWRGASARCTELGAKLVSIHSKDENDFITNTFLLNKEQLVWIGLYAEGSSLKYMWEDGSTLSFKNWAPLEPTIIQGRRVHTVAIKGSNDNIGSIGEWVEWISLDYLPFICKKKAASTTLTTVYGNSINENEYLRDV